MKKLLLGDIPGLLPRDLQFKIVDMLTGFELECQRDYSENEMRIKKYSIAKRIISDISTKDLLDYVEIDEVAVFEALQNEHPHIINRQLAQAIAQSGCIKVKGNCKA